MRKKDCNIGGSEVLTSKLDLPERRQLFEEWNATAVPYPREGSVVSEFARQVLETPESVAVEYAGESLSYRELDARSNQLAHWLRGPGRGSWLAGRRVAWSARWSW